MEEEPLVVCSDVVRAYGAAENAVVALDHMTCRVMPRDRIAISGPSGSGKSTLLHILAGLEAPDSGRVEWPALGDPHELRPRQVAIIFQTPSLLAPLNVRENVALPLVLAGIDEAAAAAAAHTALHALSLDALADKLPDELSGGQAQRVAVARVLAGSPRLVLADEPTGQLDFATGEHMLEVLEEAATRLGAAVVLTTHDPRVARRFRSRWAMDDGRLTPAAA